MLTYPETRSALNEWGLKLTKKLKQFLNKSTGKPPSKFKATGETIDSIKHRVRKTRGKEQIALEFFAKANRNYAIPDIINRGQKSRSNKLPPPTRNIEKWLIDKNVKLTVRKKGKAKAVPRTRQNLKRVAIAIGKSIRRRGSIERYGYSGTNMYVNLFQPEETKMYSDIKQAYQNDVNKHMEREAKKKQAQNKTK